MIAIPDCTHADFIPTPDADCAMCPARIQAEAAETRSAMHLVSLVIVGAVMGSVGIVIGMVIRGLIG